MIKKFTFAAIFIFSGCISLKAQTVPTILKTYRVAIFSPLYLDSVFSGNYYKYGKSFPKFTQQGLDFVQGAQIALDSMPLPNANVEATFYDSKAQDQSISWLITTHKLDSIDLVIGAVKDAEFLELAAFAKQKNVPFISTTYPNDGGITSNPFLVIVNSTLKAHCEAIYSYILQTHGNDKIFLCRKKGTQEDKIAGYFKGINEPEGKPLLNIKMLTEEDLEILKSKLDSTAKNIIIGGSLNETFSADLLKALYELKKTYRLEIIGMPNWEGFSEIRKPSYKDLPVYYTSTYSNAKNDTYSRKVQNTYLRKYKGVPSDMSYKGFESVYLFVGLLAKYPNDFISHLNDYTYKVFNDYNFKPVSLNKKNPIPDYFENKHLYFMKILNGRVSKAW